jgi:hypothetical protein
VLQYTATPGVTPHSAEAAYLAACRGVGQCTLSQLIASRCCFQPAVNRLAGGSNPSPGANLDKGLRRRAQPLGLLPRNFCRAGKRRRRGAPFRRLRCPMACPAAACRRWDAPPCLRHRAGCRDRQQGSRRCRPRAATPQRQEPSGSLHASAVGQTPVSSASSITRRPSVVQSHVGGLLAGGTIILACDPCNPPWRRSEPPRGR